MRHIARSSLIIAVFFSLEKILGFVRHIFMARTFGLSIELDAFNAANNIPDMLISMISGGALAIALIPVLTEYLEKEGRPAAWDLFSRIANLVFLVTAMLSLIVAVFASQLVSWRLGIVPGFESLQQTLVADLMRLNLISTLVFSLSGLIIAGLQANQHFLLPALAKPLYDIGALFGVLILAPQISYQFGPITLPAFGMGVHGLVYGTILGSFLFLGIQIPGLMRYKFRWVASIDLRNPGVQQVLRMMGPRVVTMFTILLVLSLIPDNIASRMPSGSIAALAYGWLFMQVPETLIGTAIGTALLPTLSKQIVRGELSSFRRSINHALRVILALTIPCSALLMVGIRPIIRVLGFDPTGTELIVWTARAFFLGLIGHALVEVGARAFYAREDASTRMLTATLIMYPLFIILTLILSPWLGAPGIALANSVAFTCEAVVLLWLINRQFSRVIEVRKTFLRVALASAGSSTGVYLLLKAVPLASMSLITSTLITAGLLFVGGLVILPFILPEVRLLLKL